MSIFEALQGDYEAPEGDRRRILTAQDVEDIRTLYSNCEYRQVDLAGMYGVSQPQISKIVNNKQWRNDGQAHGR